jgi:hypothetical protein
MQRNPSESKQHTDLIKMMVSHFNSEGYQYIKADVAGMKVPVSFTGQNKTTCRI